MEEFKQEKPAQPVEPITFDKEEYDRIIDIKIDSYDKDLNEINPLNDTGIPDKIGAEILDFINTINDLDTDETKIYKIANQRDIPVKLLFIDLNKNIIENLFDTLINPLIYTSEEQYNSLYKSLDIDSAYKLTFDEFKEGMIWENTSSTSLDPNASKIKDPNAIILHLSNFFSVSEYTERKSWEDKKKKWREEDNDIIQKIYTRQFILILNSIYPNIESNYMDGKIKIKNREIIFDIKNKNDSSIYDKFISIKAFYNLPFIKLELFNSDGVDGIAPSSASTEVYKVYARCTRPNLNKWINKDEKIKEDSPFKDEDYIFFVIFNEKIKDYIECYLSQTSLIATIPSSLDIDVIKNIIRTTISNKLDIEILDYKEKSIELETYLNNMQHIEPVSLQFYLTSNPNSSLYISEGGNKGTFSNDTRLRKIFYKSVSTSFSKKFSKMSIEYDRSDHRMILIKGPNEESCLNFFRNIFGRTIQSFFLRQKAINITLDKILNGENSIIEIKEKKDNKKKKDSSTLNPHLITENSKIKILNNLIPNLPKSYSTFCSCHRQPIILTEDESLAWAGEGASIYDKNNLSKVQKDIKSFTFEDGRVLFFTCPDINYKYISLTKQDNKDPDNYLLPCCFGSKTKRDVDSSDIKLNPKSEEIIKNYKEDNIEETIIETYDKIFISQELKHLLSYLNSGHVDEEIVLIETNSKVTPNNFLEAILISLNETAYAVDEYRQMIAKNTICLLLEQEAVGLEVSSKKLLNDIYDKNIYLDSKHHFRVIEEYFKIHIFVFEMTDSKTKFYNSEFNFQLENPVGKIFSVRPLYDKRPCVILVRKNDEYRLVSGDNNLFDEEMSAKMMELYYYTYENSSKAKDHDSNSNGHIIKNFHSTVNWEYFFNNDEIIFQEIDIAGKTRLIQLKSGKTVYIPPTQPFNVPLIQEYTFVSPDDVLLQFGPPSSWDDRGFWYDILGVSMQMYILTEPHSLGTPSEEIKLKTPLNPIMDMKVMERTQEIFDHKIIKRGTFALIQIIQWAWRVDRRPDFIPWFSKYVQIVSKPDDIINFIPETIKVTLPDSLGGVKNGFKSIEKWWPEIFSNGKIKIWTSLKEKLEDFFLREEEIMGRNTSDMIKTRLIGFYGTKGDYPDNIDADGSDPNVSSTDSLIFLGKENFTQWSTQDRIREENPTLIVYNIVPSLSDRDLFSKDSSGKDSVGNMISINGLSKKMVPIRIEYKNHWIVVKNLEIKTFNEAKEVAYGWMKTKTMTKLAIPKGKSIVIITLSFSKKFIVVETESSDGGTEETLDAETLYVLRYPDGSFASVLN